jgi:hypothetical protein
LESQPGPHSNSIDHLSHWYFFGNFHRHVAFPQRYPKTIYKLRNGFITKPFCNTKAPECHAAPSQKMFIKEDSFVYWIENDLIEDEKAADILKVLRIEREVSRLACIFFF